MSARTATTPRLYPSLAESPGAQEASTAAEAIRRAILLPAGKLPGWLREAATTAEQQLLADNTPRGRRRLMPSEQVRQALAHDRTVDITTTGRRSGESRGIEIWFHNLDGHIYISGLLGRRGWYANVVAHPDFVFHLKESAQADIPARAHPITNPAERRRVLTGILAGLGREGELEDWVDHSPLIEAKLLGREDAAYRLNRRSNGR